MTECRTQFLVLVDVPLPPGEGLFSYLSQEPLLVGEKVTVPLGAKNRPVAGFVLGESSYAGDLKEILSHSREIYFDQVRAALLLWIWDNFFTSARSLLRSLLVSLVLQSLAKVRLSLSESDYLNLLQTLSKQKGYTELLTNLYQRGGCLPLIELSKRNLLGRALEKNWVRLERHPLRAATFSHAVLDAQLYWAPWNKQVNFFVDELHKGTEENQQSLLLVPEKSLISPLENLLKSKGINPLRFSADISLQEKVMVVEKTQEQKDLVLLGTWSTLLLPFAFLGRILVLHEESKRYKLNYPPYLQVVRTAESLARFSGAKLRLFSSTPSLESFMHTFSWLKLIKSPWMSTARRRIVISREGLSPFIRKAIFKASASGKKSILFLNRRGVANSIICEDCGENFPCPTCSVSMTPHREALICHYCGHSTPIPALCPRCGGVHLRPRGIGVEGLEEILVKDGLGQKIFRIDAESVPYQAELTSRLNSFRQTKGGILLATGALVGSFLPKVPILVILNLDFLLRLPDFKATERAYQLLHNLAPLAQDELILQVANSSGIDELWDGEGFYRRELGFRKETGFPPHKRLLRLLFFGKKEEETWEAARTVRSILEGTLLRDQLSGPMEAVHYRLKGFWRVEVLSRFPLGKIPGEVRELLSTFPLRGGVQLQVELEPEELL